MDPFAPVGSAIAAPKDAVAGVFPTGCQHDPDL